MSKKAPIVFWLPYFVGLKVYERKKQTETIPETIVNARCILRLLRFHFVRREKEAAENYKKDAKIASLRRMPSVTNKQIKQPASEPP